MLQLLYYLLFDNLILFLVCLLLFLKEKRFYKMDKDFETFYESLRSFVIEIYGDENVQLIIDYLI